MRPTIRIKDTIDRLDSHSSLIHIGTLLEACELKKRLDQFTGVRFEQRQLPPTRNFLPTKTFAGFSWTSASWPSKIFSGPRQAVLDGIHRI